MKIYVDGSCRPSTRLGGFGVLIIDDNENRKVLTGIQKDVTNNIMELVALIEALKYVKEHQLDKQFDIEIFSDSRYVVDGVNEWWVKWKANGFRSTTGAIKNLDLWKDLADLCQCVKCKLTWIKGHASNKDHNEIDAIATGLTAAKAA